MNVFRHELKMMRTSMIVWIAALVGIVLMYIAIYPVFSGDAEATKKIFENLPPAFKTAFSIDVDTLLSFLGFFAFTFTNLTLFAGIHAMHTGVSILSREQRSKTTDFLLTKPRSRTSLFVQKYLAGLLVIVTTWACVTLAAFGFAKAFGAGDFDLSRFGLLMLTLLVVQLWFFACGAFTAQIMRRVKSTIPITLGVAFGFFMIGMLGAVLADEKFRYASPFKFFNYIDVASGKGYELTYVAVAAVTFVAMLVVSYVIYTKHDVKAAA